MPNKEQRELEERTVRGELLGLQAKCNDYASRPLDGEQCKAVRRQFNKAAKEYQEKFTHMAEIIGLKIGSQTTKEATDKVLADWVKESNDFEAWWETIEEILEEANTKNSTVVQADDDNEAPQGAAAAAPAAVPLVPTREAKLSVVDALITNCITDINKKTQGHQ